MDVPPNVLRHGEQLLWSGRPQRFALRGDDWALLVFGVVWAASGIVLPVFGASGRISLFPAGVGILGLAVVWGVVIARQRALRRSVYVLTERRLVVADRVSGGVRASVHLGALRSPVARVGRGAFGSVTLGRTDVPGSAAAWAGRKPAVALLGLPDAEYVRDLIAQVQAR
ncbi:hypothetical protein [Amycolatopsis sp. WQ 127309]|uniref:hypothetical protein n=1 Tax=Amycolatopsis sp. WQ 127309 TaxID=2932773 RepID=UPI001FF6462B|nr:hypothetical protein [Amycolatopsis sp. WQ 127309]UOZ07426.1 hypothetical protein MUY22_03790 [Amycolatopsis sp. WQ 127309]